MCNCLKVMVVIPDFLMTHHFCIIEAQSFLSLKCQQDVGGIRDKGEIGFFIDKTFDVNERI